MSCQCKNTEGVGSTFPCPCDKLVHPQPLNIGAGLDHLPRQIAQFPEFRRAMLAHLREQDALMYWRARKQDDLGVMLLEMWAYICDSLTFYDAVLADEAYLRTAQLRPSLRKLIALIGYIPAPAVAATVNLAAFADGRQAIKLPIGTSFRSGAFDGNPPQVFELDGDTWIHPLTNKWSFKSPLVKNTLQSYSFLITPKAEIKQDTPLLLLDGGNAPQALKARHLAPKTGSDGKQYTNLVLQSPAILAADTRLSTVRLLKPAHAIGLWTLSTQTLSNTSNTLILKNLVSDIKIGDDVLVTFDAEIKPFKVVSVSEVMKQDTSTSSSITINGSTFNMPRISTPVTQITLNTPIGWAAPLSNGITVHYQMQAAGDIFQASKTMLSDKDLLLFEGTVETPIDPVSLNTFLLQDKNLRGVSVKGAVDFSKSSFTLNAGSDTQPNGWQPDLVLPVDVFGNTISASRGERVDNEILGSGNASLSNQTFKLKKKPLTYLSNPTADNEQGISSTLKLYVNGIEWKEVANFYGKKPHERVFIVRQDDEQDSFITFGDGVRGERLPSGVDNIFCTYRFGAGKASPPAGSVNQIGKPVKGLQSVKNPIAASGGADAQTAEGLRIYAPKSALILGRVVSIQDMEAVALSFPSVRTAQTEWAWDALQLQAVAKIWYVGDSDETAKKLLTRLKSITDPTTPIQVNRAQPSPVILSIDIDVDPRFVKEKVLAAVRQALLNPKNGKLIPEQIGIGKPLYRSKLFADILAVEGATAINSIFWDKAPLSIFAKKPDSGKYFDFETTGVSLNGENI